MGGDGIMPGDRECEADGNCQLLSSESIFNSISDDWKVEQFDMGKI